MTNMTDKQIAEYAIAVRMTCSNPDVTGDRESAPVRVAFSTSTPPSSCEGLRITSSVSAEELALHIARHVKEAGNPPAGVLVEGAGWFGIHVPEGNADGSKRMRGSIAVISGAAQGFGRGIAQALALQGAVIIVADVDVPTGERAAKEINSLAGEGAALFVRTDVTRAEEWDACICTAVKAYGGVDMLISNAGILKAGSLEEMSEADFDKVTAVNYKAFFLGARAAAPIMKQQHRFNPHHFMNIIQINSKSGLEGSNRNYAYAGSKFGGIGLMQSFALELAPHHIKVNAVCPGNYFDGPLWSDPENGLFAQYLRAGKVPGANTVADVRRHYLEKVPMKRGCLPQDVATAILYLYEQEYETGQALPVTGGQVMLH